MERSSRGWKRRNGGGSETRGKRDERRQNSFMMGDLTDDERLAITAPADILGGRNHLEMAGG